MNIENLEETYYLNFINNNYIKYINRYVDDIYSLLSTNESRLIKSPAYLSAYPPLITFEPIGGFS
jgi:hypothetical protein